MHTHTLEDGAILYQSKLTLRPNVAWNRYRNDIAQRILAGKPGGETTGSRKTKPPSSRRQQAGGMIEREAVRPTDERPAGTRPIRRPCRFASAPRSGVAAPVETACRLRNGAPPTALRRNLVAIVADDAVRSACAP